MARVWAGAPASIMVMHWLHGCHVLTTQVFRIRGKPNQVAYGFLEYLRRAAEWEHGNLRRSKLLRTQNRMDLLCNSLHGYFKPFT